MQCAAGHPRAALPRWLSRRTLLCRGSTNIPSHSPPQYLGEKDLAAALSDAGGRMREREVAHLEAAPLVKLLSLLHVRGIIHRDIKPANVMMAGADGTRATLIDFGAAINAERERPRTVGGTVGHMAPEIAAPVDKFRRGMAQGAVVVREREGSCIHVVSRLAPLFPPCFRLSVFALSRTCLSHGSIQQPTLAGP